MLKSILKHIYSILLWLSIGAYIVYFSYFTILRYKTLYASYYDLGIMNQTVFNTYRGFAEKNPAKILELTNPMTGNQSKRMAIHNDLLLVPIALAYFVYPGPETLLVMQSVILGLGAFAVFKIAVYILQKHRYRELFGLVFAASYLLYPALERANIFDFHAVTLATTFLLWMIYLWLEKKYIASFLFFLLSLVSKEQVGITTSFFALYLLWRIFSTRGWKKDPNIWYSSIVLAVSIVWVVISFLLIVPYFRGGNHFAVSRYGEFGDTPIRIIIGIVSNPYSIFKYIFSFDTVSYIFFLLGPLAFLSLFSPLQLAIAIPEFAINLLSNSWGMKSIIYHYTAVITPFVFLSAIYGVQKISNFKSPFGKAQGKQSSKLIILLLIFSTLLFAYFKGPLPFAREQEIHPFKYPQQSMKEITLWARTLTDPSLKIMATGHAAPLFSSREYLYTFSDYYHKADYIVLTLNEIYNYPEKGTLIPIYNKLQKDPLFERIYKSNIVEVYKKI